MLEYHGFVQPLIIVLLLTEQTPETDKIKENKPNDPAPQL